jgi:chain length determinant protein EpsF
MSFRQFLAILRAHWLAALAVPAVLVGAALALSLLLPKMYTATAAVVVDIKVDPVAGVAYPAQMMSGYMPTQMDIVQSARVAQRVVRALKLDQLPEFRRQWQESTGGRGDLTAWLGDNLKKRLSITPSHESDVINIAVTWPDGKAAAALANAFAQAYIDTNIELKVEPARQYAGWFDQRSRDLRADLEAKQKKLSDFQNQSGLVATDERLDIESARLAELSTELVTIQTQRQESQQRARQAGGDNEHLPEVLQSPLIANLKGELSRDEAQREDIATRLGKNHPDYKTNEAEIASLRARIAQETAKVAASLGSTTQVNLRRENDVRAALAAQKKRMLELKHQHDTAADLESDVHTAQRNLDAVTQRLAQSSLESQTQQTNIVLLTPATEPVDPSSPRLALNLVLALLVGLLLGIGTAVCLEVLSPRVRSDEEVLRLLGVPLLGRVGLPT